MCSFVMVVGALLPGIDCIEHIVVDTVEDVWQLRMSRVAGWCRCV